MSKSLLLRRLQSFESTDIYDTMWIVDVAMFWTHDCIPAIFIHYFPTSKLLILSSATLELASICLTAVINCTNSHLSTDVSFATAIDMFCSVGRICYLIIWCIIFIHIIGWRLSVSINDMLCYVMLCIGLLRHRRSKSSREWTENYCSAAFVVYNSTICVPYCLEAAVI